MATVVEYCESVQAGCNAHAPPENEAIRSKICFFVRETRRKRVPPCITHQRLCFNSKETRRIERNSPYLCLAKSAGRGRVCDLGRAFEQHGRLFPRGPWLHQLTRIPAQVRPAPMTLIVFSYADNTSAMPPGIGSAFTNESKNYIQGEHQHSA